MLMNWDQDPLTATQTPPSNAPTETRAGHAPVASPEVLSANTVAEEPTMETKPAVKTEPVTGPSIETAPTTTASATLTLPQEAHEKLIQPIEESTLDDLSANPINAEDKRVINGQADINQLAPFKYPWAWKYFLNANKNHWTPLDINMAQDVHDYHHKLNDEERHVYENVLAYLTTSDILAMRNIGLAVMEKMSAPELQIYQARQVYEESLHTWTYQHCIETLGLDQSEIYNRYRVVPAIHGKIRIANRRLNSVLRSDIDLTEPRALHDFIHAYAFFAAVFEGCWFYNGFTPIFALQRRGLMKGTAEQLQYIMRDEVMHAGFGIRVVKQILAEEQVQLDPATLKTMWDEALVAETAYAHHLLPKPILGYSAEQHIEQFRHIANRRARQLGVDEPFPGAQNALPWLDEQANLRKEKNFFETRVTEYQSGGLRW